MAAFERAVAMGATEVETDVGFTKDGELLLLHDFTLDRTTNGSGEPETFTLSELKRLDAGSWHDPKLSWDRDYRGEKLITLNELFDRFGDTLTYHVELKKPTPGLVPAVVEAILRRDLGRNVYVFGIEQEAELLEVKRLASELRIAWAPEVLLASDPAAAVRRSAANGFAMIVLNASNQSREIVDLAHSLGVEARSSGISSREKMIAAGEIGCNGMTINWPDWLLAYVRGLE